MDEDRWRFERVGLGYRVAAPELQTEIRVSRLKRSGGELHGEIMVKANLAGVKTVDGVMHVARFNLSSSSTRNSLAKLLESRTPGQIQRMDWFDGLETLCQKVMLAETTGQPYIEVGTTPVTAKTDRYVIDPLVPANVTSLLYGPGGSGKSIIALACAMSVQNHREIIPGLPPAITGNVLYLDWETDGPVINERVQAIATGAGFTSSAITYRRCIRPLAEEAEEIANAVAERDIVFMVIDSAGMAMGASGEHGDSNESTLRLFDAIRHIGISTQVIDHVSKQEMRSKGKVQGLLPYGSIYKVNLARSAWEVRNGTSEDDETVRLALIHTKANDSRLKPQIGLEVDWQPGQITFHAAEVATLEPMSDDEHSVDVIMSLLSDGKPRKPPEIIKATGIKANTVYRTLKRAADRGELLKGPDGSYRVPGKSVETDAPPGDPWWTN
jgi:RecA-family ATPase